MRYFIITLTMCWTCGFALAQESNTSHTKRLGKDGKSAPATLADVKWLVGNWKGEGLGQQATESWAPAAAGNMLGTFRLINKKNRLVFSEFFILQEVNKSLVLRLKHFDADFKGWEEKDKYVEFKLIKVEGRTAWFDGLTYQIDEHGKLHAWVAMKTKNGFKEVEFVFSRVWATPTKSQ